MLGMLGLLAACGGSNSSSKNSTVNLQSHAAATCQVEAPGSVIVVCIDFADNTPQIQTTCDTAEQTEYAAEGATGSLYTAITGANVETSCSLTNTSLTQIGSCVMEDRAVRYYNTNWTTATAQTNCQSIAGQWQP